VVELHEEGDWRQDVVVDAGSEWLAASETEAQSFQIKKRVVGGWALSCACGDTNPPTRGVVLDIFSGSGTTGEVALDLGRDYIGIDLNMNYLPLAERRIQKMAPPSKKQATQTSGDILDLFGL
jgi:methylase of polypeptide subunit release factors